MNARFKAAALLGTRAYEAVNELSVVEVYTQVYEGDLTTCSTIIDVHLRILAESMIDGDWERPETATRNFDLPPQLKRQSLLATAAVAEAALLFTKEEYEYTVALLQDIYDSPEATEELKEESR